MVPDLPCEIHDRLAQTLQAGEEFGHAGKLGEGRWWNREAVRSGILSAPVPPDAARRGRARRQLGLPAPAASRLPGFGEHVVRCPGPISVDHLLEHLRATSGSTACRSDGAAADARLSGQGRPERPLGLLRGGASGSGRRWAPVRARVQGLGERAGSPSARHHDEGCASRRRAGAREIGVGCVHCRRRQHAAGQGTVLGRLLPGGGEAGEHRAGCGPGQAQPVPAGQPDHGAPWRGR